MGQPIDHRVVIGHVHLGVADLERALAFYQGVLGFAVVQRQRGECAFVSAGGYHHHIVLRARNGTAAPLPVPAGACHFAIRYPDRAALADAVRRLDEAGIDIVAAHDHGVSEAIYLDDPDGHRVELYWDRPREQWPRAADGSPDISTQPLDLESLRAEARPAPPASPYALMNDRMRHLLGELRARLLHLHKVLLDDARAMYELDRGRVASNSSLLQLVIHDPWFAWLHALSELVVRIDQAVELETPATDADAQALVDSVERLLTASEDGEGFARRYYEALQRQPAVVLAHAAVRRAIKDMR